VRASLGRIVLAVAFLLAQHTALAHQVWHASGEPQKSTQNSKLCEQHAALGAVLGALNGCQALGLFADAAPVHFAAAHAPAASLPALPAASRGPPRVS
jgi:hypothetical protein